MIRNRLLLSADTIALSGLGHFGILLAKALGAERIVGISRRSDKRADVVKMGADEYVATDEDQGKASTQSDHINAPAISHTAVDSRKFYVHADTDQIGPRNMPDLSICLSAQSILPRCH